MNPGPTPSPAVAEINRLHEEARRCSVTSRQALHGALFAAWQAGHLLIAERTRVVRDLGPGTWLFWLKANFHGTVRTAQRYIRLAHGLTDAAFLQGMSLRQAYARLGIATEPKTPGKGRLRHTLPAHLVLANRLVRTLERRPGPTDEEPGAAYRRDLRVLYEKLRGWFEPSRQP